MSLDHHAIRKAYPSIVILDDSFKTYGLDKDGNKVTIVQSNVDAARVELAKLDYRWKREYPELAEQLDQLYWDKKNGTNKWVEAIDKVKSDNPKP
tara:strand:- start:34 stop:318 length:285 start_codon:yes stop_codon:yes gene_type:complete